MFKAAKKPIAPPPRPAAPAPRPAAPAPAPVTLRRPPFLAPTPAPAPTGSGRGSIFGGGGSRNQPPPVQPPPVQPPPAAPSKSPFAGISAGEGRAMANRMGRMGMKEGGKVSSASKRADGCAVKGKTKGKMV